MRVAKNRLLAAFVVAFLCLNVGGALCLTICGEWLGATASAAAGEEMHLSEHCRMAMRQAAERDKDLTKIDAGEASCCMMPVAMFAAPVEKPTRLDAAQLVLAQPVNAPEFTFARHSAAFSAPDQPIYRPPPLDLRPQRLLNCVIRI